MENPTVACTLMASKDFTPDYAVRLYESVKAHWTGELDFLCLTDTPINYPGIRELPLEYRFPGTWCKTEMCRPDVPAGDLLTFDLDTMIVGSLEDIQNNTRHAMLKRLRKHHRHQLAAGIMFLPKAVRGVIWDTFSKSPKKWMKLYKYGQSGGRPPGEQGFYQQTWERLGLGFGPKDPDFDYDRWNREGVARWQELFPGQIESYKLQVSKRGALGRNTRVVVFHGKPRPHDIGWTLPPRVTP